jgi:hypothetical protein
MAEKPQNFSVFLLDNKDESKLRGLLEFVNNCNKSVLCGGVGGGGWSKAELHAFCRQLMTRPCW